MQVECNHYSRLENSRDPDLSGEEELSNKEVNITLIKQNNRCLSQSLVDLDTEAISWYLTCRRQCLIHVGMKGRDERPGC